MGRFVVEPEFWAVFPDAKIGVLLCWGLDNSGAGPEARALLEEAQGEAARHISAPEWSQNPVIGTWRRAFQGFRTKKGVRSSIEALLKRVQSGHGVGSINPLVDLYNSVSLRFAVPCGGEDLGTIEGDIRLTRADGDEPFITLGSRASDPPLPGELVYKDDAGAICRGLNWRESARTMLRSETTDAFMCLENVDPAWEGSFLEALDTLRTLVTGHLGGNCTAHVLTRQQPKLQWSALEVPAKPQG